jgi:hypothetical protein
MSSFRSALLARCATALFTLGLASPVAAQSTFSNGTTRDAGSVTKANVTGADMAGMAVSWGYANGSTGAGSWSLSQAGYYSVGDSRMTLLFESTPNVTTNTGRWQVFLSGPASTTPDLSWIRLNGGSVGVAFDCGWVPLRGCAPTGAGDSEGSTGSGSGYSFQSDPFSDTDATASAAYTNAIGLGGANPVGDLYEELTITFSRIGGDGLEGGDNFSFTADTDLLDGGAVAVPEPSALALLIVGALTLLGAARRRLIRR